MGCMLSVVGVRGVWLIVWGMGGCICFFLSLKNTKDYLCGKGAKDNDYFIWQRVLPKSVFYGRGCATLHYHYTSEIQKICSGRIFANL